MAAARIVRTSLALLAALAAVWGAPAAAQVGDTEVTIRDLRFTPAEVRIAPGTAVVWRALEAGHTVTADAGAFDTGRTLAQGDTFRWVSPSE
ncbi:MAG TPA: hypothetical protein VM840_13145, partial [Actinomycetota bacterium]|nr:hypothetical protein [Actinomycetota bacterium]